MYLYLIHVEIYQPYTPGFRKMVYILLRSK